MHSRAKENELKQEDFKLLTAVATNTGVFPLLKFLRASSLSFWDLSPWIQAEGYPSLYKKLSRASAPFLVSTKTSVSESGPAINRNYNSLIKLTISRTHFRVRTKFLIRNSMTFPWLSVTKILQFSMTNSAFKILAILQWEFLLLDNFGNHDIWLLLKSN